MSNTTLNETCAYRTNEQCIIKVLEPKDNMRSSHPKWMNLPDVAMIEVFKYLPDYDRARAAQVCTRWSRIFDSPCLWRTRFFELGGYRAQQHGHRATKFAESFGHHLKFLTLSCSHPSYYTCKLFQKSIDEFFSVLKEAGTQLVDFELCRLELERYWKYDTPKEKLISIFSKFMKTQRRLKSFDMSSAQLPAFGGCRVLDAIANQSGNSIQDLIIEDFFHSRLSVHQVKKFLKVTGKFTNLKYLSLNYNCLSEDVLETLTKSLENKLKFLNIKVFRTDPHMHRISGLAWKQFTRACPRLRVAFWFESIGHYSEIAPILQKEVPVKDIHIWSGYDDDQDWKLGDTISHIADSYTNILESISFELDNTQEIVDPQLLSMLLKCKKLRELSINAMISIQTVETICEMVREKKIDVTKVHLTCCGLSDIDWKDLLAVRDKHMPMFKENNISFVCTTDLLVI